VSRDQAYNFYKTYGTCLKGLLVEGIIDEAGVEVFLREVHDIDYGDIVADPELRSVLEPIVRSKPTWIFTASVREHAQRCLEAVGLADLPWRGIIDCRDCDLETKHSHSSFERAMRVAGADDPTTCLFADDSKKNVVAAKQHQWRTILVGKIDRDTRGAVETPPEADAHVGSLRDIGKLLGIGTPLDLNHTWCHLGLGATSIPQPPFTDMSWYSDYAGRVAADQAEGRLVSMGSFDSNWGHWEMHPDGTELVICTAGAVTLIQDVGGPREPSLLKTTLRNGQYAVNPPGVWHTADVVEAPVTCIFITAGRGTQHKPR